MKLAQFAHARLDHVAKPPLQRAMRKWQRPMGTDLVFEPRAGLPLLWRRIPHQDVLRLRGAQQPTLEAGAILHGERGIEDRVLGAHAHCIVASKALAPPVVPEVLGDEKGLIGGRRI